MPSLGRRVSSVQLRVGAQFRNDRSRTSVQAGVISQPRPGQHWGLRPFRLHVPMRRDPEHPPSPLGYSGTSHFGLQALK
jgi:hypothetical protein